MYNIIFLGDRKIAADALKLLSSKEMAGKFQLRVLVSSDEFITNACKFLDIKPDKTISNIQRNTKEIENSIEQYDINLLISVQHNWILSRGILSKVGMAFNLHNARLPDFKGYNCISHAICNRERTYYTTIHWMAEEVDTGDIAYDISTVIETDEDALSLYRKTIASAKAIFGIFLKELSQGLIPPRKKISGDGIFYKKEEVGLLKDVTGINDPVEKDFRVRGVFFPPHEPAFIKDGDVKTHIVPEKWRKIPWETMEAEYLADWKNHN